MVTLGFLTLNRYDLLEKAIKSAEAGSLKPDKYFVVDNGSKFAMTEFYATLGDRLEVARMPHNIGVAGGWNYIIQHVPDIRIVANDDVEFYEDTIKMLVEAAGEERVIYPAGIPSANSFSCYILPDSVVAKVGLFDEKISPNYGYFEDNDYHRRMSMAGVYLVGIAECRLGHLISSTLKRFSDRERAQHNEKFKTAKNNYIKKWGGEPGQETRTTPNGL